MAKHLARIHGTEEDKVNCPFYFKIGACRHADRCSRLHHRPAFSQTILIKHIYRHPVREAELRALAEGLDKDTIQVDKEKAVENFLQFFENMYEELGKFGRLECLHVCDNLGDHMIGHVYAKFSDEEQASDALNVMNGRHYDGRKMQVEFSPVTDFREARCRDFDEDTCSRGGFCNFMHIKPVPMCLIRSLEDDCAEERRKEAAKRAEKEHRDREHRRKKRHRHHRSDRDRDSREHSRRERKRRMRGSDVDDDSGNRGRGGDSDRDDGSRRSMSRSSSRSRIPDRHVSGSTGKIRGRSYTPSRSRSRTYSRSRSNDRRSVRPIMNSRAQAVSDQGNVCLKENLSKDVKSG